MGEPLAAPRGGGRDRLPVGTALDHRQVARGQRAEGLRRAHRQHQRRQARSRRSRDGLGPRRVRAGGRRAQYDVGIGTAETEGIDADRERRILVLAVEFGVALDHAQPAAREIDGGVGCLEVQRARHRAVLQAQHGLQQPGHARGGFQVADVGLDRADQERLVGRTSGRHHLDQRARLDRVAHRRAGAVRLEIGHLPRVDAGARVDAAQQLGLGGRARHADATLRVAVGIDARAGDHGVDRVAVRQRALERLEQHEGAALGAHVAVAAGVEGAATAARREHRGLREADEAERVHQQVHPAGQRHVGLTRAQRLHRLVQRDQRGRAGRVDRQARAAQVEQVGHAVGGDAESVAGGRVRIDRIQVVHAAIAVVGARHADEHAAIAAAHVERAQAGVLERLPGEFEQQALLRVHLCRLARRDAEKRRIESRDVVQHTGRERVALAGLALGGVLVELRAEAPGRNLRDGIALVAQQAPKFFRIIDAPGKAACDPNNCNLSVHLYVVFSGARDWSMRLPPPCCVACSSRPPSISACKSRRSGLSTPKFRQMK